MTAIPAFDPMSVRGLALSISADDVRPEPGFGRERREGPLGLLLRLYEEFGCKATLFVPTDWQGRLPLSEHLDWLGWLLEQPGFEVACHGHLHAIGRGSPDPGELRGAGPQAVESVVSQSLEVFQAAGHRPLGFKAPGWFLEPSAYSVLDRHFGYVADHVIGTEVGRLRGGRLLRFPYLFTIDVMGPWPEEGLTALQSHIAAEGTITNAWTPWHYARVREFVRTGQRIGARFLTLGELASELSEGAVHSQIQTPASVPVARLAREAAQDQRLRGGKVVRIGQEAAVLYNADGAPCPLRLSSRNAAIVVLSRNRRAYLADLLKSIDETGPPGLGRTVILNNCEDDSAEFVRKEFGHWRVVELDDADHPEEPIGLAWLKEHRPDLLPQPADGLGPASGWTGPRSTGWLRNRQMEACGRDFLVSFDDDFVVKPGWWEYYVRFQRDLGAHAVINNFGAFVMCRTVPETIGAFDERFLGSHGCEDNDWAARLAEAGVRWALGFNVHHDWRSAEEGNPRGSMTGSDLFVHRYALAQGGYSARRDEALRDPVRAAWNGRWFAAKWEETTDETGITARPPFRGVFLRRKLGEERWNA
jgi:peptidoglycan/xylan/chitin deacetylase (PgdA/CDA1 family)